MYGIWKKHVSGNSHRLLISFFPVRDWLLIVTSLIWLQSFTPLLLHPLFLRNILKINPYPKLTTTTHKISPGMSLTLPLSVKIKLLIEVQQWFLQEQSSSTFIHDAHDECDQISACIYANPVCFVLPQP